MAQVTSRTRNSITNSLFGIVAALISVMLNFGVRYVLIKTLGEEINGLHNLFQSITNVLLLMELGIGSAMIIHLYEPIQHENHAMIAGILKFYQQVYRYIAVAFFLLSLLLSVFFLQDLVHSSIDLSRVRLYFLLFTLSFVLNYLTNYKRSILFAEQKNRVSILFSSAAEITFRSIQIVTLFVWQQYVLFLVLTILEKLVSNYLCNRYIDRHYPYLKNNRERLSDAKRRSIFTTVKSLMLNNVASTVQQSARSLLISMLLGNVSIVGYYGNYQLIMSVVELIYSQFGGALTSSFGNLAIEKDTTRMQAAYKKSAFLLNWIAAIFCAGFLVCVQDFIQLIFGASFLINWMSVWVLGISLMVYLVNIPIISIQNAMGLHHLDAYYMLFQAVLAIGLGYFGGLTYGMTGIFVGMLIPMIVFTSIRKGIVVTQHALKMPIKTYLSFIAYEWLKMIAVSIVALGTVHGLALPLSFGTLLIKAGIVLVIGVVVPVLLSFKQAEFRYAVSLVKTILKRKLTR
ncbi:MAG: hypothetical protein Q4B80_00765 [Aerococcaceae bacterium]|nr:hypothetical protein [Aerococcaceae bacterium]